MTSSPPIPDLVPNCGLMEEMATSFWLRLSLSINLTIAFISIPIIIKSISYIKKQQLFHVNTRIQIQVHLFGLLMHSTGRLALHTADLHNYFSDFNNGCEVLPGFYRCLVTRGLYNCGMALCAMTSISLVIERSIALIYSSTYEYFTKTLGYALAILQVFLAFCFLFKLYYYAPFKPDHVMLYYCQTLASGTGTVWTINAPLYVVMFAQIFCRIVFQFLSVKNEEMRNSHQSTLSTRFNLEQSKRSIRALNMFVNVNSFVFVMLSVVGTTLHFNSSKMRKPHYFAIVEVIHLLPTYAILLSISVYITLRKMDRRLKISLTESIQTNPDYYFKEFNKQLM